MRQLDNYVTQHVENGVPAMSVKTSLKLFVQSDTFSGVLRWACFANQFARLDIRYVFFIVPVTAVRAISGLQLGVKLSLINILTNEEVVCVCYQLLVATHRRIAARRR